MRTIFMLFVVVVLLEIVLSEDVLGNAGYVTGQENGDMNEYKGNDHYDYVIVDFGSAGLIISMLLISVCVNLLFCCLILTGTLTWKTH